MTELKCKIEQIICVDYGDLEHFIAKQYGLDDFEILESQNDVTHDYNIKKEKIDDFNQKYLTQVKEQKSLEYWALQVVLYDLCNKDLIPTGKYAVRVSW